MKSGNAAARCETLDHQFGQAPKRRSGFKHPSVLMRSSATGALPYRAAINPKLIQILWTPVMER
jgi:hypothetical protein